MSGADSKVIYLEHSRSFSHVDYPVSAVIKNLTKPRRKGLCSKFKGAAHCGGRSMAAA